MAKREYSDPVLLGIASALVIFGLLVLASVSASFSMQRFGTPFYYFVHQIEYGLLPGLALGIGMFCLPLDRVRKGSFMSLVGTVALLFLVFMPVVGTKFGGAHRWISLGSFSFQPSEFLKLTSVLYLAAWLSLHSSSRQTSKTQGARGRSEGMKETFVPFLCVMAALGLLLLLQPDIGTLGIIALSALTVYFVSSTPPWHTMLLVALGIAGLLLLIYVAPYRINRLAVFLDPALDPLGKGFQAKQALISIGSGGVTGVGAGMSMQKFGTLPEPISDSIFAIFSEEMGFIGGVLLLSLFLAFGARALALSLKVPDEFSRLAMVGIAAWFCVQAFVNIGSMIGLIPLTGVPLPFFSYGGTALMTELAAIGLVLNISKQTT